MSEPVVPPNPKELEALTWSPSNVNDETLLFYKAALRPSWKKNFIENGCNLYNVIYSDDKRSKYPPAKPGALRM